MADELLFTIRAAFSGAGAQQAKAAVRDLRQELARLSGARPEIDLDTGPAREAILRLREQMRDLRVEVPLSVDSSGLRREVGRAVAAAGAGQRVRVEMELDADTRGAGRMRDELEGVRQSARGTRDDVDSTRPSFESLKEGLLQAIVGLGAAKAALDAIKWPALIEGVTAGIGGLVALSAAAIGLVGALSPLVGLLPAVGVGILALAQGGGVVAGAFSGIGDALKAYVAQQKAAAVASVGGGAAAASAARTQRSAAEAVRSAVQGVADARRSASDAVTAAARRVEDADRAVGVAQRGATEAQRRLTEAREEARQELEDLRLQVEATALAEEGARLRLERARRREADAATLAAAAAAGYTQDQLRALEDQLRAQGAAADAAADAADATLDVSEAELRLRQIQAQRADELARLNELTQQGVEGNRRVVDARQSVLDAEQRVADAQRSAGDAVTALARAQEDGSRRIEEALHRVELAQIQASEAAQGMGGAGAAAADKFAAAMAGLSPAAQSFVRTLISFQAPLQQLRDVAAANLFPGLEAGLRAVMPLFTVVQPLVAATAGVLGDLGAQLGTLLGSPFFQGVFRTLGEANVRILDELGRAALILLPAVAQLAVAAAPLAEQLARMLTAGAGVAAEFVDAQSASGGLANFMDLAAGALGRLGNVMRPLITLLVGLGRAGFDTGNMILEGLGGGLQELSDTVNSLAGQTALREFFASIQPLLREVGGLLGDLGGGLIQIAREVAPQLTPLVAALREKLLPALLELFGHLDTRFLGALIELATSFARLVTVFGTSAPVLSLVVGALRPLVDAVVFLGTKLGPLSSLLVSVVTLIGLLKTADLAAGAIKGLSTVMGGLSLSGGKVPGVFGLIGRALAPIGTLITGTVIPAITSFITVTVGPMLAAAAPFLLIGAAVIGLGALLWIFRDQVGAVVGAVGRFLGNLLDGVVGFARDWGVLLLGPVGFVIKFRDEIAGALGAVGRFFGDLVGRVGDFLREWGFLFAGPLGVIWHFRDEIAGALGTVIRFFTDLPGSIGRALGNIGEWLLQAGRDLIQGFINGIGNMARAVRDALVGLLPGPLKKFAGLLGLDSPSRLMFAHGRNTMQGYVNGVLAMRAAVAQAFEEVAAGAEVMSGVTLGAPAGAAAGGAAGAPTVVNEGDTYHIYPAPGMDEADLARRVSGQNAWAGTAHG